MHWQIFQSKFSRTLFFGFRWKWKSMAHSRNDRESITFFICKIMEWFSLWRTTEAARSLEAFVAGIRSITWITSEIISLSFHLFLYKPLKNQIALAMEIPWSHFHSVIIYGNWYGPAFLQSDWLIAGPHNTIRTTFFNFCRNSYIFKFPLFWHRSLSKFDKFLPVVFSDTLISDNRL